MNKEEFIKKIEAMGFVKQEPVVSGAEVYSIQNCNYLIQASVYYECLLIEVSCNNIRVVKTESLIFSDDTINIINRLLIAYDDIHNYTITFNIEDMIKDAEFCGYKINEKQAKNLIYYLYRKADGVYETIQQYITGYCQDNKFEELKEDEE